MDSLESYASAVGSLCDCRCHLLVRDTTRSSSHASHFAVSGGIDFLRAVVGACRVLKPGGVAVVAYLNSWRILRALLTERPTFYENKERILALTREFTNLAKPDGGFTDAYFTIPPKTIEELQEADLAILIYAGAESFPAGCIEPLTTRLSCDPQPGRRLGTLPVRRGQCSANCFRPQV